MNLLELAERCESIPAGVGRAFDKERFMINCEIERLLFEREHGMMRSFTESLDAAMTLVPDGWGVKLDTPAGKHSPVSDPPSAAMLHCLPKRAGAAAATPALALCAAALKARAASVDRSPEGEKPQALNAQHESAVPEGQTSSTKSGAPDNG